MTVAHIAKWYVLRPLILGPTYLAFGVFVAMVAVMALSVPVVFISELLDLFESIGTEQAKPPSGGTRA